MTLGVTLAQYLCNEAYLQQIRYIAWSNARAISRVPIVSFEQRAKDIYWSGVIWLYEALGMTRIPDEEYLLEQRVRLAQVDEELERARRDLAQLEAIYASRYNGA